MKLVKICVLLVMAGANDRTNTPVKVFLTVPSALSKTAAVTLKDEKGTALVGQLTKPGLLVGPWTETKGQVARELHFLLPSLKKGATATFTVTAADPSKIGDAFKWNDTAGKYNELSHGKRPVLRYMYEALDPNRRVATYKIFHHLYDPTGSKIVTKGPGGKYTHHRGLFFGFSRIRYEGAKRVDIWHCSGDTYQSHAGFVRSDEGPVIGRHLVNVDWHGVGKKIFANEQREMSVYSLPGGTLVEFASRLSTAIGGPVKLDGDPQHAGFQFRASNEVAAMTSAQTYYLRPDGKGKLRETRNWPGAKTHVNLPWNAMSFVLGEQRYTTAYIDHPTNPKEARYSERDYGRFGSYFVYTIDERKPLLANYRIWHQEGEMTVEQVSALSRDFTEPVKVKVK